MIVDSSKTSRLKISLLLALAGMFGIITNKTVIAVEPDANEISKAKLSEVKVAAIQCSSILGDVEANRTKITKLVSEAAKNGYAITVLRPREVFL